MSPSYGCFVITQPYDAANVQCSINALSDAVQPFEYYWLKSRAYDYANRHGGELSPQELEDNYQEKTAALDEIGEWSQCPVEHCDAIIPARNRTWNKRLKQWICLVCNGQDGHPLNKPEIGLMPSVSQKRKCAVPDVSSAQWCTGRASDIDPELRTTGRDCGTCLVRGLGETQAVYAEHTRSHSHRGKKSLEVSGEHCILCRKGLNRPVRHTESRYQSYQCGHGDGNPSREAWDETTEAILTLLAQNRPMMRSLCEHKRVAQAMINTLKEEGEEEEIPADDPDDESGNEEITSEDDEMPEDDSDEEMVLMRENERSLPQAALVESVTVIALSPFQDIELWWPTQLLRIFRSRLTEHKSMENLQNLLLDIFSRSHGKGAAILAERSRASKDHYDAWHAAINASIAQDNPFPRLSQQIIVRLKTEAAEDIAEVFKLVEHAGIARRFMNALRVLQNTESQAHQQYTASYRQRGRSSGPRGSYDSTRKFIFTKALNAVFSHQVGTVKTDNLPLPILNCGMGMTIEMQNSDRRQDSIHREATVCRLSVDTPLLPKTIVPLYGLGSDHSEHGGVTESSTREDQRCEQYASTCRDSPGFGERIRCQRLCPALWFRLEASVRVNYSYKSSKD